MTAALIALLAAETAPPDLARQARIDLLAHVRASPPPRHSEAYARAWRALLVDGSRVRWISSSVYTMRARDALIGSEPGRRTEPGDLGVLRHSPEVRALEVRRWTFTRDDGYQTHGTDRTDRLPEIFDSAEDTEGPAELPAPLAAVHAQIAKDNAIDLGYRQADFRYRTLCSAFGSAMSDADLAELQGLARSRNSTLADRCALEITRRAEASRQAAEFREIERRRAEAWGAFKKTRGERRKAWAAFEYFLLTRGCNTAQIGSEMYAAGICEAGSFPKGWRTEK